MFNDIFKFSEKFNKHSAYSLLTNTKIHLSLIFQKLKVSQRTKNFKLYYSIDTLVLAAFIAFIIFFRYSL